MPEIISDLEKLVDVSHQCGRRIEYTHAVSGNTSVKFGNGIMAIKQSGTALKDMTVSSGFSAVSCTDMVDYVNKTIRKGVMPEKEVSLIAMDTIQQINGEPPARPSVEVGFHSILQKYVIHLHPCAPNVLMCSKGGMEKAAEVARRRNMKFITVDYGLPGNELLMKLVPEFDKFHQEHGCDANVIFMKNHGIATTAETAELAMELMDEIINALTVEFDMPEVHQAKIKKCPEGFENDSAWAAETAADGDLMNDIIFRVIEPSALEFTTQLSIREGEEAKITIDKKGRMVFHTEDEHEAMKFEEAMIAFFYIYRTIKEKGWEYDIIPDSECCKVIGWTEEQYKAFIKSKE